MRHSQSLKYTMKAAEVRAIAEDDEHGRTRAGLLKIAETYDKLAQHFEQLETSDPRVHLTPQRPQRR